MSAAHHGEAVVHTAPACAGVHAADLELVRIVAAQSDPEHQPTGCELRQRRELARHRHRVAQQEQVHRGVHRQRGEHGERGRLHEPVVPVAVAEADVVADAQVVEPGGFGLLDERPQRPRPLLERGERRTDADARGGRHARGSFGSPSTRSATMFRWISLAPP